MRIIQIEDELYRLTKSQYDDLKRVYDQAGDADLSKDIDLAKYIEENVVDYRYIGRVSIQYRF